jgi:hypothetical protein
MVMEFLLRFHTTTRYAPDKRQTEVEKTSDGTRVLLSRLASPNAELVRANTSWRPNMPCLRIEIIASGPFENLRGVRAAVNRLQDNLVTANRERRLELRLTEVRRTCRHSTPWSGMPIDPSAGTTVWECLIDEFDQGQLLFAQAFRDSLRNNVNHIVILGDRYDDGFFSLNAAIRDFRQRGIRVSTFYLGADFNTRNMYRFLAASTGGLFIALSVQSSLDTILPVVAAFACGDQARLAALQSPTPEAKALIAQIRRR